MSPSVLLTNRSSRMRVGCKGPGAENWLADQGIVVPQGANRFSLDSRGLLSARLATSEFLFEATETGSGSALDPSRRSLELGEMPSGVYPVLRQDFVVEITGARTHDLFAETCAIDLVPVERDSTATSGPVILTSMIGVGAIVVCRSSAQGSCFTVWSDPSYSHYFWNQLLAIAVGLGGGAATTPSTTTPSSGATSTTPSGGTPQ
jgi:hypothetical protein